MEGDSRQNSPGGVGVNSGYNISGGERDETCIICHQRTSGARRKTQPSDLLRYGLGQSCVTAFDVVLSLTRSALTATVSAVPGVRRRVAHSICLPPAYTLVLRCRVEWVD